jgi:hypothetical protein
VPSGAKLLAIVILTAGADMVTEKLACRANQWAAGPINAFGGPIEAS